jgi:hypothetical protein
MGVEEEGPCLLLLVLLRWLSSGLI